MRKHRDLYSLDEHEMREEIKARKRQYESREERKQLAREIVVQEKAPLALIENRTTNTDANVEDLEDELLKSNQNYLDKLEVGKQIFLIVGKGVVREEALPKHRKEALDLYMKQKPARDISSVELRPWQQEVMDLIAVPTKREVIWIQGMKGNEGKSWFQDYVASFYRYGRVVQLDLKMKTPNVLHALAKRPLSSLDIFLFNEPRALNKEVCNYTVLESIKDGGTVASKYDNDFIRFKVPNVVVVFSNARPKMKQLSPDRWRVLRITKGGLNNITDSLWKAQANPPRDPNYKSPWNTEEYQESHDRYGLCMG